MRILKSNLLNDGKLLNDGRPVDPIQIEDEKDFDFLFKNIINSKYYDTAYFDSHIDYREGEIKFDSLFLSSILKFLNPKSLLELGCGRADILFLLGLDERIKVRGIEFSQDVLKKVWPLLAGKVGYGDILEVSQKYRDEGISFDTFCAFNLWEHLHPQKLSDYIEAVVALAEKDALFFYTIPAFGEDRIFGEIFPLELEENRDKFNRRLPFDYLNAESIDPAIPANGHLIWAHTEWWQKQFEAHGLIRAEGLERNIHTFFDEHLFYARKCFYIFHLDSPEARNRIENLFKNRLTLFKKWKVLVDRQTSIRRFEKQQGKTFIDSKDLGSTIHHAEFYMIRDMKKQIEEWSGLPLLSGGKSPLTRPFLSLLDRLTDKWIRTYINRCDRKL